MKPKSFIEKSFSISKYKNLSLSIILSNSGRRLDELFLKVRQ